MFSDTCCLCYSEALTLVFDCRWKCDLPKLHLNVYHNLYCVLQIKYPISKHPEPANGTQDRREIRQFFARVSQPKKPKTAERCETVTLPDSDIE